MSGQSHRKNGFTLGEVLVVVIILGILASIAVPSYIGIKRKVYDYGAQSNLKLVQAAEKSYRIEARQYIDCANSSACNAALRMDMPVGGYWDYSVPAAKIDNNATPQVFCAEANNAASGRQWHIDQDDAEAINGACP